MFASAIMAHAGFYSWPGLIKVNQLKGNLKKVKGSQKKVTKCTDIFTFNLETWPFWLILFWGKGERPLPPGGYATGLRIFATQTHYLLLKNVLTDDVWVAKILKPLQVMNIINNYVIQVAIKCKFCKVIIFFTDFQTWKLMLMKSWRDTRFIHYTNCY